MNYRLLLVLLCVLLNTNVYGQDLGKYKVRPAIDFKATPFDLRNVRLLDGSPFKQAMEVNAEYLLELDADRLLHRWRKNAGLEPKAPLYGGWEATSSHMLGHYLSACAIMYAASGDERFLEKVNYVVRELAECQEARKTGYVGGIPNEDEIFNQVAAGNIHSGGFDLNGGWVPWYMIHKVWDGLLDAYLYCDNKLAKEVVVKLSDWAYHKFKDLPEVKFQEMLEAEFGGMNESLAEVYAITGDKRYLELAYRFEHKKIIDPLAEQIDQLGGLHANTQIPKILGSARLYEFTGSKRDHTVADFFWNAVVKHHSYVNGGNSNFEYFSQRDQLASQLSTNTSETCNTYNMLKLTDYLFSWNPSVEYIDYYERALYNHILASQHPETGMFCYYVALESGREKKFSTPFESFWCCVGTGIENHVKYGESIYYKGDDESLYVNLFIPSELKWKSKGVTIRQETKYPEEEKTLITISGRKSVKFPIHIRYPAWATKGMEIKINEVTVQHKATPGSYLTIERKWKEGDEIEVFMPMNLYTEALPGAQNKLAILYGPVLLSGELGEKELRPLELPVLVANDKPVNDWVKSVEGKPLLFQTAKIGKPKDLQLIPFYEMYDQKHVVYWDLFSEEEWKEKKAAYEAEVKELADIERRTVDVMRLGEMQPERDHNLKGDNSGVGEFGGKKFRDAPNGGWFSFEMKCDPLAPLELHSTYYGSDGGNRKFDILVDGVKIATEHLKGEKPREFVVHVYPIPQELTKGKESITVRFQAHPGNIAGGSYGCKLVKRDVGL